MYIYFIIFYRLINLLIKVSKRIIRMCPKYQIYNMKQQINIFTFEKWDQSNIWYLHLINDL